MSFDVSAADVGLSGRLICFCYSHARRLSAIRFFPSVQKGWQRNKVGCWRALGFDVSVDNVVRVLPFV